MYPDKAFESREYELPFSLDDVENASIKEGGLKILLNKMFSNPNGSIDKIVDNFRNYLLCEENLYTLGETIANIYLTYKDSAYEAIEKTSQNIKKIKDAKEMLAYKRIISLESSNYMIFSTDKRYAKKNYHQKMKKKLDNFILNFDIHRNTEEYKRLISTYSKEPQELLEGF